MKMSKSIKDYKDAMDNIKISDSFYKRTEVLLTELPEDEIESRPILTNRRITAAVTGIAACLLMVFGLKFAYDKNNQEIATTTEITEITIETEVDETAPELIDSIEDDDSALVADAGINMDMPPIPDDDSDTDSKNDYHAVAEEKDSAVDYSNDTVTEQSAETTAAKTTMSIKEGYPDLPEMTGAENVPALDSIVYENVTVEITPYFNMGTVKSGENSVKGSGTEYSDIIDFISQLTNSSHELTNNSFTSVFSIRISDSETDVTFYSIYLTDLNSIIVTTHKADGQERVSYGISHSNYEALKHMLFLQFGSEDEYEIFFGK